MVELLGEVGDDHRDLIDAQRRRIQAVVGTTVVKPAFPTPLQKRLAS